MKKKEYEFVLKEQREGEEKLAALKLEDLEDNLGVYLTDAGEQEGRDLVEEQNKKRFPLRHPVLTGIPTLGIAPGVSKARALDEARNTLLRKHEKLRELVNEIARQGREQEAADYSAETDRLKATQAERAVGAASGAALSGLGAYLASKDLNKEAGVGSILSRYWAMLSGKAAKGANKKLVDAFHKSTMGGAPLVPKGATITGWNSNHPLVAKLREEIANRKLTRGLTGAAVATPVVGAMMDS